MKEILKKYKIILNIIIYLILISAFFLLAIKPTFESIKEYQNKIQKTLLDQESQEKRIAKIPELEKKYEELMKEKERIDFFFTEEKAVDLVDDLENLARQTGNEINIEFQKKEENKTAQVRSEKKSSEEKDKILKNLPLEDYLKIKIGLRGSFDSLISFLKKIENMRYYSDVISLNIAAEKLSEENKKVI